MFKVKCKNCGQEVERTVHRKDALCFPCKSQIKRMKANTIYTKTRKARELLKKSQQNGGGNQVL